jgi:hypothetical protein
MICEGVQCVPRVVAGNGTNTVQNPPVTLCPSSGSESICAAVSIDRWNIHRIYYFSGIRYVISTFTYRILLI